MFVWAGHPRDTDRAFRAGQKVFIADYFEADRHDFAPHRDSRRCVEPHFAGTVLSFCPLSPTLPPGWDGHKGSVLKGPYLIHY